MKACYLTPLTKRDSDILLGPPIEHLRKHPNLANEACDGK